MKPLIDINKPGDPKGRDAYLFMIRGLLKSGKEMEALLVLKQALKEMPNDPFILSYYGCLTAIVEKKPAAGTKICMEAIDLAKKFQPFGDFIYPVFFLNLGRCYLAGSNRKKAIEALFEGLKMDAEDPDILGELNRIGRRKKPPLPFLPRNNPLNKYVGIFISRIRV